MLVKTSQPNCEQWAWCVSKYLAASGHYFMVLRDWPIVYQFILLKTRLSMQYNYLCIFKLAHFLGSFWFPAVKSLFANPYKIFLFPWSQFFVTWAQFPVRLFSPSDIRKNCPTTFYCIFQLIWVLMTTTHIRMCFRSFYIILFSYGSPLWIHLNFLIPKGGPLWKKCLIEGPETRSDTFCVGHRNPYQLENAIKRSGTVFCIYHLG